MNPLNLDMNYKPLMNFGDQKVETNSACFQSEGVKVIPYAKKILGVKPFNSSGKQVPDFSDIRIKQERSICCPSHKFVIEQISPEQNFQRKEIAYSIKEASCMKNCCDDAQLCCCFACCCAGQYRLSTVNGGKLGMLKFKGCTCDTDFDMLDKNDQLIYHFHSPCGCVSDVTALNIPQDKLNLYSKRKITQTKLFTITDRNGQVVEPAFSLIQGMDSNCCPTHNPKLKTYIKYPPNLGEENKIIFISTAMHMQFIGY